MLFNSFLIFYLATSGRAIKLAYWRNDCDEDGKLQLAS